MQPFDRVNGKWVLYGLGNMVAQQEPERRDTFRGIVARLTLTERPDGGFRVEDPRYAADADPEPHHDRRDPRARRRAGTTVADHAPLAARPGSPGSPVDGRRDGATGGASPPADGS